MAPGTGVLKPDVRVELPGLDGFGRQCQEVSSCWLQSWTTPLGGCSTPWVVLRSPQVVRPCAR